MKARCADVIAQSRDLIDRLVDERACADLTGRAVRATSLRIKPGRSVVAGLSPAQGGAGGLSPAQGGAGGLSPAQGGAGGLSPALGEGGGLSPAPGVGVDGFARVLWPDQAVKARKPMARAARRGHRCDLYPCEGGHVLLVGELVADPALGEQLHRHRQVLDVRGATAQVVRYNPMKRVVAHLGSEAIRVATTPMDQEVSVLGELASAGVPVVPRLDRGTRPHLARYPWCGTGDLAGDTDPANAAQVGRMLAAVHRLRPGRPGLQPVAVRAPLAAIVAELHLVDAATAELGRRIADTIIDRWDTVMEGRHVRHGLLHGDASADQVLHDRGSGQLWLTDFERIETGPAAVDLGSYRAVLDLTFDPGTADTVGEALLEGYRDAGGTVSCDELDIARARAEFLRCTAALRQARPDWAHAVREAVHACADRLA